MDTFGQYESQRHSFFLSSLGGGQPLCKWSLPPVPRGIVITVMSGLPLVIVVPLVGFSFLLNLLVSFLLPLCRLFADFMRCNFYR